MPRKYYIIKGSKAFFDKTLESFTGLEGAESFINLVLKSDACRNAGKLFTERAKIVICRNDNYHAIVEQAHDRLGPIVEELSSDDAVVFIHNPPDNLQQYIDTLVQQEKAAKEERSEDHNIVFQKDEFRKHLSEVSKLIVGQDNAVEELGKSILYSSLSNRKRPYVIMLYGNSSIGKTELVKTISEVFYGGKFLETHMSMFQNLSYADYIFGDKPNRKTFAYELYERESNVVFLDEIDKCLPLFYSAFYSLFDMGIYKDSTYVVDTSGLLIVMTSNYEDTNQMKKELGLPVFYRIEKFVKLNNFSTDTIMRLAERELGEQTAALSDHISIDNVRIPAFSTIGQTGENARTIKNKVLAAIENELFNKYERPEMAPDDDKPNSIEQIDVS